MKAESQWKTDDFVDEWNCDSSGITCPEEYALINGKVLQISKYMGVFFDGDTMYLLGTSTVEPDTNFLKFRRNE